MCFGGSSQPVSAPPPPPPPPPPTATAVRAEPTKARAARGQQRKRGTRALTITRRPSLGMQPGQTGVQLTS